MEFQLDLHGVPVVVSISKNPHFSYSRFNSEFSPYDDPYDFEILSDVSGLDEMDEAELFGHAVNLLHDHI